MKENEKSKRKGISLIVLVITIIVIIILAAAVMLNIDNNNPIENAKKAKISHNESVYQEELELYAINEYANNTSFNKDTLNVFDSDGVKKIITSMTNEDLNKYIIWQGQLIKKDGDKYKYINGEEVKLLGKYDTTGKIIDQTPLSEKIINFVKVLEDSQKSIPESERVIYSNGYITNIIPEKTKVEDFKNMFPDPSLVTVKKYDDTDHTYQYFATDTKIYYDGSLVAIIVIYADTNGDAGINISDTSLYPAIYLERFNGSVTPGKMISCDVDHNGIINKSDEQVIIDRVGGINNITQNYPAKMPVVAKN